MQFNHDQSYWGNISEMYNFNTNYEKKYIGQISFNYQQTAIREPMSAFLLDAGYARNDSMKYFFSNIRTNIKDIDIEYLILEISGNLIDKISGNMLQVLRDLYDIKDKTIIPFNITSGYNYFPVLASQDIKVILNLKTEIKFNSLFSFNADLYELNGQVVQGHHNYLYRHVQSSGSVVLNNTCKSQLYFSEILQYLIIKSDNQINSIYINVSNGAGRLLKKINVQNLTKLGDYYLVPFVQNSNNLIDGLNCNVLDLTLEFLFTESKITEINVFGVSIKKITCDHLMLY